MAVYPALSLRDITVRVSKGPRHQTRSSKASCVEKAGPISGSSETEAQVLSDGAMPTKTDNPIWRGRLWVFRSGHHPGGICFALTRRSMTLGIQASCYPRPSVDSTSSISRPLPARAVPGARRRRFGYSAPGFGPRACVTLSGLSSCRQTPICPNQRAAQYYIALGAPLSGLARHGG